MVEQFPLVPRTRWMSPGSVGEARVEEGERAKEEGGARCVAIARIGLAGGREVSTEGSSKVSADEGPPVGVSGKED